MLDIEAYFCKGVLYIIFICANAAKAISSLS